MEKGLGFKPRSVWFPSPRVFHYNLLPQRSFGPPWPDSKSREAHPARGRSVFGPRASTLGLWCFSSGHVAPCLSDWRLGGREIILMAGRAEWMINFHRRNLFSDYLGVICSTKYVDVIYRIQIHLPCVHIHTGSVAMRASGLKSQEKLSRATLGLSSEG